MEAVTSLSMDAPLVAPTLDYFTFVTECFSSWSGEDDIYCQLQTRDLDTLIIPTKLLAFYSPKLSSVLQENTENIISLDEDSRTISTLLDLLKHGKSQSLNKEVILAVVEAGESLGIHLENISYSRLGNEIAEEKPENLSAYCSDMLEHEENIQDTTEELSNNTEHNLSQKSFIKEFDDVLEQHSDMLEEKPPSGDEDESSISPEKLGNSRFDCNTCGNTFQTRNKLGRHMLCHTGFRCNVCSKGFRMLSLLKRHLETNHIEEMQDQYFTSENETLTEDTHENEETQSDVAKSRPIPDSMLEHNFECKTCGKMFKTKAKLSRHSLCHTNFKCSICSKGFRLSSLLQRHMSTLHMDTIQMSSV